MYYLYQEIIRENAPALVSSANDEWEDILILKKGEYCVELHGLFGLGFCKTEEELESLYKNLTNLRYRMTLCHTYQ